MVKLLKNQRGNAYIFLIIFIFTFIWMSTLVIDYSNLNIQTKKIKYAMNRAVKAAALQIQEGNDSNLTEGESLANGIFLIDEEKSEEVFKEVLASNLGLDEVSLEPLENSVLYEKPIIREFKVINSYPSNYLSPVINQTYEIEHPSVVATLEFKVKSTFLVTDIQINKFSGSQLTSVYD